MTNYHFKGYKPGFEVAQKEIGFEVARKWVWPSAHTYDDLKNEIGDNFNDESIIYCFADNRIVGYTWFDLLPSTEEGIVRAWLEFPKLLPGHEQAFPLMIEKALEIMKGKGITNVKIRGSSIIKDCFRLLEESGFREIQSMKRGFKLYYVYDLSNGPLKNSSFEAKECTTATEFEKCADIATRWYKQPKDWVLSHLREAFPPELTIAHLFVEKEGDVKAACIVAPNNVVDDISAFHYIYSPNEKYLKPLVSKAITMCIDQGYKTLVVDLINEHRVFEDFYSRLGFTKAAEMGYYEINI